MYVRKSRASVCVIYAVPSSRRQMRNELKESPFGESVPKKKMENLGTGFVIFILFFEERAQKYSATTNHSANISDKMMDYRESSLYTCMSQCRSFRLVSSVGSYQTAVTGKIITTHFHHRNNGRKHVEKEEEKKTDRQILFCFLSRLPTTGLWFGNNFSLSLSLWLLLYCNYNAGLVNSGCGYNPLVCCPPYLLCFVIVLQPRFFTLNSCCLSGLSRSNLDVGKKELGDFFFCLLSVRSAAGCTRCATAPKLPHGSHRTTSFSRWFSFNYISQLFFLFDLVPPVVGYIVFVSAAREMRVACFRLRS